MFNSRYLTRLCAASILALSTSSAFAGGIDRSSQFLGPLFETGGATGSSIQFGIGRVNPSAQAPNLGVGNPLGDYNSLSFAFKTDLTEQLSFAFILEEPYGADIQYPLSSPFAGGGASVNSEQISAILRYKFNDRFSIIGGIRALKADGFIDTFRSAPVPGGLAPIGLTADGDFGLGGVVGVAYEIPDIALRIALSYNSSITTELSGSETLFADAARTTVLATGGTTFDVTFPESLNLEFQTGIAKDTLLFGSVRYAKYDGFNVSTATNPALFGGALGGTQYVNFSDDTVTFNLGVGRQFNEKWSGSISFGYEDGGVTPSTTALAPTTGFKSVSLSARYKTDFGSIAGGISYIVPGDQLVNSTSGTAEFDDNEVVAVGLRFTYDF